MQFFNKNLIRIFGGEKENMSEFIWHWTDGDKKIFTRKTEVAEKAMKNGFLIMGRKAKPEIIKYL